ncbi:MAG: hypothetical protein JJE09_00920 [Bacteroidia bacterium]|nr:hypothetical protein [Bacteroidia bacterium]
MRSQISISIVILLISSVAFGQDIKVRGSFMADSVKIGEQIPFSLTASYPKNLTVIFPDSTYSVSPFEFQKKKFFTTQTTDGLSYDSVVYLLATFEIDSVQQLKLPVYVVNKIDCTAVFSNLDDVILNQLVRNIPDSVAAQDLPLKTNTNYLNVKWLFNYPVALIISGGLLVLAIVGFLIFGKRVRKYFLLRKLNRNHQNFITKFSETISGLHSEFSTIKVEAALVLWKNYMENLVQTPFSKLTSKEIIRLDQNEQLGSALHSIDRAVYGGINSSSEQSLESLRLYCEQQFRIKLEETKNG